MSARKLPLHRALVRPLLLAGCERPLAIMNGTLIAMLLLGVGINQFTVIVSFLLATFGFWALRMTAAYDPHLSKVYVRHIRYQSYYPARASIHANAPVIHSSITYQP